MRLDKHSFRGITKRMMILWWTTLMLVLSFNMASASATNNLSFKDLQLSFWIEYDQHRDWPKGEPSTLTMYNGKFINNGSEPYSGRVEFKIPKDKTIINMACETKQGMVCMPYDAVEENEYKILSWQPSKPINPGEEYPFMLEFYSNSIQGTGNKTANLSHSSIYPAQLLNIDIKQPLKATKFQTIPTEQRNELDSQGFKTYHYQYTNVPQNKKIEIQAQYSKTDNEPSIIPNNLDNQGLAQTNNKSYSSTGINNSSGIIILILIALIGFCYLVYSKPKRGKKRGKRRIR